MKVKCINKVDWTKITIGKIYEVIEIVNNGYYYVIIDDTNNKLVCIKKWVKPLSEYRNETIDKLLK